MDCSNFSGGVVLNSVVEDSPNVHFDCRGCGVFTKSYNTWRKHLLGDVHQEGARRRVKLINVKGKKRMVVVFGVSSVKAKDVLKYFGDLAIVVELVFWKERPDLCLLTFCTSQFRDLVGKLTHTISGKPLFLRPLDEIPEAEWISICPYAAIVKVELESCSSPEGDPFQGSSDEEMDDSFSNIDRKSDCTMISEERVASSDGFGSTCMPSISSLFPRINENDYSTSPAAVQEPMNDSDYDKNFDEPFVEEEHQQQHQPSLCSAVVPPEPPYQRLERIMEHFYNRNLMEPQEWELRKRAAGWIENLLQKTVFKNSVVIPFGVGSTAISCGKKEVLNLYLDVPGYTKDNTGRVYRMDLDTRYMKGINEKIVRNLRKGVFIRNVAVAEDKVSFQFNEFGATISCRLQVTNFLTVQCCRVVNFMLSLDHRVRPLLLIVRHWAYHHQLVASHPSNNNKNERQAEKCLHPTVFQWLVIHFLIHKNILPSIERLQQHSTTKLLHGGANIAFCNDATKIGWTRNEDFQVNPDTGNPSSKYILILAKEFFKYFGEWRLQSTKKTVICTSIGEIVTKSGENSSPFINSESWEVTKRLKVSSPLCIQHPLKLSIDMAENVSEEVARMFAVECVHTVQCIERLLGAENFDDPISVLTHAAAVCPFNLEIHENRPDNDSIVRPASDLHNNDSASPSNLASTLVQKKKNKQTKIPCFNIVLKQCKNNYNQEKWIRMVRDFNEKVWLSCFGVTMYELFDDDSVSPAIEATVAPLLTFKGVISNRKKLEWAYLQNSRKALKKISIQLSELMLRKQLSSFARSTTPNAMDEKCFSFICTAFSNLDAKRKNGSSRAGRVTLQFTKIFCQFPDKLTKANIFKFKSMFQQNISRMYHILFSSYEETFSDDQIY